MIRGTTIVAIYATLLRDFDAAIASLPRHALFISACEISAIATLAFRRLFRPGETFQFKTRRAVPRLCRLRLSCSLPSLKC